jgi:hypothetical protein
MNDSFFAYIERLELIAFFSGYTLVYLIVQLVSKPLQTKRFTKMNIACLLPLAYAVTGLLYLGLQLKNLYPDYSFAHIRLTTSDAYLKGWALLSLLFFFPLIAKRKAWTLLHSLVFFYFIVADFFRQVFLNSDKSSLQNDMQMYSRSITINLFAFVAVTALYFFFAFFKRAKIN